MKKLLLIGIAGALVVVGGTLGAVTLAGPSSDRVPPAPGEFGRAQGVAAREHAAQQVDGRKWRLGSFTNPSGATCVEHEVPLEGTATGCINLERLFAEGRDVVALPGARQISSNSKKMTWDNAWVYGFASPRVASVELVTFDCITKHLTLDASRAFMYVASRSELARGSGPYKVIGRDSSGAVVDEANANVGLPANAREAGVLAPRPGSDCAEN